jgi:hypothetical protein
MMKKMVNAYVSKPDAATASRLLAYISKHPMALCMADEADLAAVKKARACVA